MGTGDKSTAREEEYDTSPRKLSFVFNRKVSYILKQVSNLLDELKFRFLELLSNYKEEIAIKMQKRHENMIGQMKKELRKEGEADKKKLEVITINYPFVFFRLVGIWRFFFLSEF